MVKEFKPKIVNARCYNGIHIWYDELNGKLEQINMDKEKWHVERTRGIIHIYRN
jgi:hypothetical protein